MSMSASVGLRVTSQWHAKLLLWLGQAVLGPPGNAVLRLRALAGTPHSKDICARMSMVRARLLCGPVQACYKQAEPVHTVADDMCCSHAPMLLVRNSGCAEHISTCVCNAARQSCVRVPCTPCH